MLKKMHKEMNDFTLNIKTIKSHEELLNYMNSSFSSSIKLLISVSSTFSICLKVVLPFIVSLVILLMLSNIEPSGEQSQGLLNINYILAILLCLVSLILVFIIHSKKYFISCMDKSKDFIEKATQS